MIVNMLKIRHSNLHTEKRTNRKILRKFALLHKKKYSLNLQRQKFYAKTVNIRDISKSKTKILYSMKFSVQNYIPKV